MTEPDQISTEVESDKLQDARREANTALGIWVFLRLFIPTGPILIQYGLKGLGAYEPPFPQVTYIVLMFSLSLVTLIEYKDLLAILYLAVAPALAATCLYTVVLLTSDKPVVSNNTLLAGFFLWLVLVMFNTARVIIEWRRKRG